MVEPEPKPKPKPKKSDKKVIEPVFLEFDGEIEGLKAFAGTGPMDAEVLMLGDSPGRDEIRSDRPFCGKAWKDVFTALYEAGIDSTQWRMAYAVRYKPKGNNKVKTGDIGKCKPYVYGEIEAVKPKLLVTLGANAFRAVAKPKSKFTDYQGAMAPCPAFPDISVFATYSPWAVFKNPDLGPRFKTDIANLARVLEQGRLELDKIRFATVTTLDGLKDFKAGLDLLQESVLLTLDCEWHGETRMHPDRYIRTVQLSPNPEYATVVVFRGQNGVPVMDNEAEAWQVMKTVLEHPMVRLCGHNILADGQWLLSYGIDIRPNTVHDTMLVEHLLNEAGPFGLEQMSLKYSGFGRYDLELAQWKSEHAAECRHGFGPVPDPILLPYAATDTGCTYATKLGQEADPEFPEFTLTRHGGRYPSLFDIDHCVQNVVYEMEDTGMPVDRDRLRLVTDAYAARYGVLKAEVMEIAASLGFPEFNPRSTPNMQRMLFETLKLEPVSTTGEYSKPWSEVKNQPTEVQDLYSPSTNKTTLEIHQDAHVMVKKLLHLSRIGTALKMFLRDDEDIDLSESGGGIKGNIWPDGRLHPRYSQLKVTGRMGTSSPNVQNLPKQVERAMIEAFGGKDNMPPMVRSVVLAPPGWVIVEPDFVQAELFVLARLSGDVNMIKQLEEPGRDLHDKTSIDSFKIVTDLNGVPVSEDDLVEFARQCGGDTECEAFTSFVSALRYTDAKGRTFTRKEFKDGVRVAGKSINFGIPYGRQALAIALQVKAETGDRRPVHDIAAEVQVMMDTWKETSYPSAWAYMVKCGDEALDRGVLATSLGRKRRFPKSYDSATKASYRRKAQNFRIQSLVADAIYIAMWMLRTERERRYGRDPGAWPFLFMNQIHDALQLLAREDKADEVQALVRETMGSIEIPIPDANPLVLGVDIDVYKRWGSAKRK